MVEKRTKKEWEEEIERAEGWLIAAIIFSLVCVLCWSLIFS